MWHFRMKFILFAMLGVMVSARAGAGDLVLTGGNGLSLATVSAKSAPQPIKTEIIISGGFQAKGIKDASLRVQINGLDAVPPGSEIMKAVLKYDAQPGNFPPPLMESAPFAQNVEMAADGKLPAIAITGQGAIEVDVSPRVQQWVLQGVQATNLSLIINVSTGTAEKVVSGVQHIDPKSVRLEIKYGAEFPQYRLPAPVVEKIVAEQDRTISLWWQPALPEQQLPGEKYWYEFEMFLPDDLWQKANTAAQERRAQYDRWQTTKSTDAEFEKIMNFGTDADVSLDGIRAEAFENLASKKMLAEEAPTKAKVLSFHWTNMVSHVPPLEPKAFTNLAGDWMALRQFFPQGWIDNLAVEENFARLNLGPEMVRAVATYKFRLRVRCSNGQVGPWAETPEVQQHNPGYLVWSSRACYRGRFALGDPFYGGDEAYARNVYDQEFGVHLEAAKDEYEPFQVFFKNDQSETVQVELRLSDLKGEKGTIPTWAMYPYIQNWIADAEGAKEKRRPKFPPRVMVDPLAPLFNPYDYHPVSSSQYTPMPAPCLPGLSVGWWVDVRVPGSTPAGVYRGSATLVVNGKTEINVPVEMEVWDFFMPRRRTVSTTFGDAGPGKNRAASYDRWLKMLQAHRAGGYGGRIRGDVDVYDPDPLYDGDEVLDSCYWDHYIRTIRPYVDGSLFEDGVPVQKVGLTGWYVGQSGLPFELEWPGYTGNGKLADKHKVDMQFKYLRELRLIARRMGFLEKLWFYDMDEPPDEPNATCVLATTFMHFKKVLPEAKNMVTSMSRPNLRGWITAYNANPTAFFSNMGWFLRRQELGEEYWFYNSFSYLGGNDYMDQRMVPWYGWREGAANWLCWISNYGADWDWFPEQGGDGLYNYPLRGYEHGVSDSDFSPNLQLKLYREGMEDIELCALAVQAVGYQAAREIFLNCCWTDGQGDPSQWGRWKRVGHFRHYGGMNYNADPRSVYQVRRDLAALIAKHKPDDGSAPQPVPELIASARKQQENGELLPALQTVKQALQKAPADLDAGALEVACYHAMQMPQEALESALRMVRRNESAGFAWKTLGDTYAQLSRFEDAQHCWQQALTLGLADAQERETRAAIADSSLEGAQVARAMVSPYMTVPDTSNLRHLGQDRLGTRKWPQEFDGGNIYRGLGPWGGFGNLDPTPAGLPRQLIHIDMGKQSLPKNAKIRRAMIVYQISQSARKNGGNMAVYAMRRPWINQHMTIHEYDKNKAWSETMAGKEGEDRGPLYAPSGCAVIDMEKGEVRLDITRNFKDWVEGRCPNYGLALVPQNNYITAGSGKLLVYYTQD